MVCLRDSIFLCYLKIYFFSDLNVSNNLLHTLPDDIATLKHLQNLNAASNNWTEIPEGVYRLESLKELKLQDNKIEGNRKTGLQQPTMQS